MSVEISQIPFAEGKCDIGEICMQGLFFMDYKGRLALPPYIMADLKIEKFGQTVYNRPQTLQLKDGEIGLYEITKCFTEEELGGFSGGIGIGGNLFRYQFELTVRGSANDVSWLPFLSNFEDSDMVQLDIEPSTDACVVDITANPTLGEAQGVRGGIYQAQFLNSPKSNSALIDCPVSDPSSVEESEATILPGRAVVYKGGANGEISLNPGFFAQEGSDFHAYLEDCVEEEGIFPIVEQSRMFSAQDDVELMEEIIRQITEPAKVATKENDNTLNFPSLASSTKFLELKINPNPFNEITALNYFVGDDRINGLNSKLTLRILTLDGRELQVLMLDKEHEKGAYNLQVNLLELDAGIYFFELISNLGDKVVRKGIKVD